MVGFKHSKFNSFLGVFIASAALASSYGCEKAQIVRQNTPTSNTPQSDEPKQGPTTDIPVDDHSGTPTQPSTDKVTFASVYGAVFKENCEQCHNATKSKGGVDLSSSDGLLNPKSGKHVVVAGDSASSKLYSAVEEGDMPPRGALTADQIALLKKFIDDGANP